MQSFTIEKKQKTLQLGKGIIIQQPVWTHHFMPFCLSVTYTFLVNCSKIKRLALIFNTLSSHCRASRINLTSVIGSKLNISFQLLLSCLCSSLKPLLLKITSLQGKSRHD